VLRRGGRAPSPPPTYHPGVPPGGTPSPSPHPQFPPYKSTPKDQPQCPAPAPVSSPAPGRRQQPGERPASAGWCHRAERNRLARHPATPGNSTVCGLPQPPARRAFHPGVCRWRLHRGADAPRSPGYAATPPPGVRSRQQPGERPASAGWCHRAERNRLARHRRNPRQFNGLRATAATGPQGIPPGGVPVALTPRG
jgi:hypothetical protein